MAIAQNNPITYNDITTALNEKANSSHTHVKSDITDFSHTHDDRYYTKSEVDSLIYDISMPLVAPTIYTNPRKGNMKIINNDERSVTFYYKKEDRNVSKTNYDGFATVAFHETALVPFPPGKTYVRGYIKNIISNTEVIEQENPLSGATP